MFINFERRRCPFLETRYRLYRSRFLRVICKNSFFRFFQSLQDLRTFESHQTQCLTKNSEPRTAVKGAVRGPDGQRGGDWAVSFGSSVKRIASWKLRACRTSGAVTFANSKVERVAGAPHLGAVRLLTSEPLACRTTAHLNFQQYCQKNANSSPSILSLLLQRNPPWE